MLYQQGTHNGSNMGTRMHSYPHLPGLPAEGRAAGRSAVPAAGAGLGQRRQPDRARRGRDGVGQLLHDARREAGGRPRVQLAGRRPGLPGPSRSSCSSYDYWVSRFARDPGVVGKKILRQQLPDDDRRRVGRGVSPASIRRSSPQIRVPILMKPVMVPEWGWLHMDDRRARWVQVFARLKPGYTVESAAGAAAGAVHADPHRTR